ncbi:MULTISPECIES: IclR family transcriptional regulator [Rhodomicrobium]|uniref:IclR family transcriptional regulator n=1 Tax=Rhodomicrobium TaxID=1068 RepID=UPI00148251BF|nr:MULTISPECIES: IclR family transcriptional regulator [Rhodomicrobium]
MVESGAGGAALPQAVSEGIRSARTIQSIERALDLLDILAAANSELPLGEIAAQSGLNSSTCHHLLATLVKRGYVGRNRRARTYFLGARILELSNSRLKQFNISEIAMPELRQLNHTTGESVHLAVMQGYALVTLAKLDARLPVRVGSDAIGKSNAAHATATGKAILAWLPEPEIARVIANHGLPRFTEKTIGTIAGLMEDLRLTRRNGFSIDNEEFQPGVVCIGAAVRDHAGAVIAAVSCSMPQMRAKGKLREKVKLAVKLCAATISERLGSPKDGAAPNRV